MNTHSTITAEAGGAAPDAPYDPEGERTERHLFMLSRLGEIGMELAETVAVQARVERDVIARSGDPGAVTPAVRVDFASAFAKVSRAVRMGIMLEDKLAKALRLRQAGIAERHQADRRARQEAEQARDERAMEDRIDRRQDAIIDAVREVIRAERPERLEQERLMESLDRLWAVDFEDGFFTRPELYVKTGGDEALVSDQIAAHCKALGLKPDWGLWKQTFWAVEEAGDGAAGSPYAHETPLPNGEGTTPHPQDGRMRDYDPSG